VSTAGVLRCACGTVGADRGTVAHVIARLCKIETSNDLDILRWSPVKRDLPREIVDNDRSGSVLGAVDRRGD
jgi:hypothetical protein